MLLITNLDIRDHKFFHRDNIRDYISFCYYDNEKTTKIDLSNWIEKLYALNPRHILLYIHGFNNQPESDIIPNAIKMQKMFDNSGVNRVVIPIIWPCDSDFGLIKDYYDDRRAAKLSGKAFAQALVDFIKTSRLDDQRFDISVLAHSMGNLVLIQFLNHFANAYQDKQLPILFDEIFLMAADIANDVLEEDKFGKWVTQVANKVVCFYAKDDYAMPASSLLNFTVNAFKRRLGQTGPRDAIESIELIDCTNFNQKFDFPKGHTYFLDESSPAWKRLTKK